MRLFTLFLYILYSAISIAGNDELEKLRKIFSNVDITETKRLNYIDKLLKNSIGNSELISTVGELLVMSWTERRSYKQRIRFFRVMLDDNQFTYHLISNNNLQIFFKEKLKSMSRNDIVEYERENTIFGCAAHYFKKTIKYQKKSKKGYLIKPSMDISKNDEKQETTPGSPTMEEEITTKECVIEELLTAFHDPDHIWDYKLQLWEEAPMTPKENTRKIDWSISYKKNEFERIIDQEEFKTCNWNIITDKLLTLKNNEMVFSAFLFNKEPIEKLELSLNERFDFVKLFLSKIKQKEKHVKPLLEEVYNYQEGLDFENSIKQKMVLFYPQQTYTEGIYLSVRLLTTFFSIGQNTQLLLEAVQQNLEKKYRYLINSLTKPMPYKLF